MRFSLSRTLWVVVVAVVVCGGWWLYVRWCVIQIDREARARVLARDREAEGSRAGKRDRDREREKEGQTDGRTKRRAIETRFLPPGVRSLSCIPR